MRKFFSPQIFILFALFILVGCETYAPVSISGKKVDFSFYDFKTNSLKKISDYKGRLVVLNIWASWCPPCMKEIPDFVELQTKLDQTKATVISINVDKRGSEQKIREIIAQKGINFPVFYDPDSESTRFLSTTGFPETFIISKEGEVLTISDPESGKLSDRIRADRKWGSALYVDFINNLIKRDS